MKTKASLLLVLPLLLVVACRTTPMAKHSTGAVLVHREPTEREFADRVTELTKVGHSREAAERKARREFARDAWSHDSASAWADEKAREERGARREQMEKTLAKLPAY